VSEPDPSVVGGRFSFPPFLRPAVVEPVLAIVAGTGFHFWNVEQSGCACAPGLRSRSYFGGVGSADRPAVFLEPVKRGKVKMSEKVQKDTLNSLTLIMFLFTPQALFLTNPHLTTGA
jgi:hypothetical protein